MMFRRARGLSLSSILIVGLAAVFVWVATVAASPNPEAFLTPSGSDEALPNSMVPLPGHILPALAKATRLAPNASDSKKPITLTLVLRNDDEAGFLRYLSEVYDPQSANFLNFLDPEEISSRFGPSRQSYEKLCSYLRGYGLRLVEGSPDYQTITVSGRRRDAERAFALKIHEYQIGARKFYANQSDPMLPANLALEVEAVIGLSDLALPHHSNQSVPDAAFYATAAGGEFGAGFGIGLVLLAAAPGLIFFTLAIVAFLFGLALGLSLQNDSLFSTGEAKSDDRRGANPAAKQYKGAVGPAFGPTALGTGQTVGLIEFDTFQNSDVSDYLNLVSQVTSLLGLPPANINNLSVTPVNGGVATPGPDQAEVLLDIDDVMTVAPGAKVAVYDAPFNGAGSFQAVLSAMITGGVNIISNSWAYCEDQTTLADVRSIDSLLQKAAMAGITVLSGTGDNGSTCLDGSANTAAVPADSPNLTAVGGRLAHYR